MVYLQLRIHLRIGKKCLSLLCFTRVYYNISSNKRFVSLRMVFDLTSLSVIRPLPSILHRLFVFFLNYNTCICHTCINMVVLPMVSPVTHIIGKTHLNGII